MQNAIIKNIFSAEEISQILNNPDVKTNELKVNEQNVVKFSIELSAQLKTTLENKLSIDLAHTTTLPMRWIKGDTMPHIDRGESAFTDTYLVYLTDSVGNLIVDDVIYPISAGDAHIFSEGLEHSTINTGNTEARLILGPMSEMGFPVGLPYIIYFSNITDATNAFDNYNTINSLPNDNSQGYTVITIDSFSTWIIYGNLYNSPPPTPTADGTVVPTGYLLEANGNYYVYPYVAPPPPAVSNICFRAGTPITTDQGIVAIEEIDIKKHTIRQKQIKAITKTVSRDKYLVCFAKDALGPNVPCEKTVMSKNHLVWYNWKMHKAKEFVEGVAELKKEKKVTKVKYNGEILYNVLLETYEKMLVNNLICETLHPDNKIAELYTLLAQYNVKEHSEIIKKYNTIVVKHKMYL